MADTELSFVIDIWKGPYSQLNFMLPESNNIFSGILYCSFKIWTYIRRLFGDLNHLCTVTNSQLKVRCSLGFYFYFDMYIYGNGISCLNLISKNQALETIANFLICC